jgi:hypothetical protein
MKSEPAMEEHLVGYLLGSLDPLTHKRVELYLRTHPEAQETVELLRQALAPLDDDGDDLEPPPGLVLATLDRVAEFRSLSRGAYATRLASGGAAATPLAGSPHPEFPTRRWSRRIDWAVAACLLLLVGGLALPAVISQWRQQKRLACADNLRRFHTALIGYSDGHAGAFPRVEPDGPRGIAGIFIPLLTDAGLAQDVSVCCPAHGKRRPLRCTAAELEELYKDDPARYQAVSSELAGHYAYCLGYEQNGRLCGLRRDSGDLLPIMADRAGADADNSPNHSGAGQNVLFISGNVRWCAEPTAGVENDHIYLNQRNRVGAGVYRIDTVLGASDARPFK